MGGRGLLIATGVLAVLGGAVWWSNREKAKEEGKPAPGAPPRVMAVSDGDIAQLDLKRKDGTDTVLRRINGKWVIAAPKSLPADAEAVSIVTNPLASLSADSVVEEKPGDVSAYGLKSPSFEIDVKRNDGKSMKLLIGDDTPTGSNSYAMVTSDPRVFTIASSLRSSLDKTWQDLRDKRLLTFDPDKLASVELDSKKSAIQFGKVNQSEWTILKPKPLRADGWQVEELIRKLKDSKMDTSLSDEDAKKAAVAFAGGTPVATVKLTEASGTQTLEVRKVKDDYYAKSSVVDGVFKVAADLATSLDKSVDDLRNKKLFDFGFSEPGKLEFKSADKPAVVYAKSGEKWFSGPKQIDATSLQNAIDKLRDLAATKFVDSGFTTPVFEATVTYSEGKKTEKVQISKSGADYFARRENEPSIYQLDPKAADDLIKTANEIKPAAVSK